MGLGGRALQPLGSLTKSTHAGSWSSWEQSATGVASPRRRCRGFGLVAPEVSTISLTIYANRSVQDGWHVTGQPGSNIVRTKDRLLLIRSGPICVRSSSVTSSSAGFGQDNRVAPDCVLSCGAQHLVQRHNALSDDNKNSRPFRRIILLCSGDSPINTGLVPSPFSFLIISSSPRKRASIA